MHLYRSHNCNALKTENVGEEVKLSGWVHRKRDHGNLLFIDLRDHYGITQLVVDRSDHAKLNDTLIEDLQALSLESVITVTGTVVNRTAETINKELPTGDIEVVIESFVLES